MQNISQGAKIGENVVIKDGVIVEDSVIIGDNCYIDYHSVLRENVVLGENSFVGANCILGEFLMDTISDRKSHSHILNIGANAVIRSGSIFYGDTTIGDFLQTGHNVIVREGAQLGDHVSIGTLTDIQGRCEIGNHVRMHSNVFISEYTKIKDYAWLFPHVVVTNDPTPPSDKLLGVTIEEYACICAGATLLPGIVIGRDALVGAGALVTKDVENNSVVVGNPAKYKCRIEEIKDIDGNSHYPWKEYFHR